MRNYSQTHREEASLHRNIEKREIATTALFLCSEMASAITGSIVYVGAGHHAVL